MIIHEKYCKKCHKVTNHRELKHDFFECTKCKLRTIEKPKIREENIDMNEPSYWLYIDEEYVYFNDMLSANITTREEIRKLLSGGIIRIPMYRNKYQDIRMILKKFYFEIYGNIHEKNECEARDKLCELLEGRCEFVFKIVEKGKTL